MPRYISELAVSGLAAVPMGPRKPLIRILDLEGDLRRV